MKRIVVLIVSIALLGLVGCAAREQGGEVTSRGASEAVLGTFAATDMDGNAVDESILSGKKVTMINLWAPWCGPCVGEMPDLQKLNEKYADKGFQVIGVIDEADLNNADETIKNTGVKYPILKLGDSSSALYQAVIGHPEFQNAIPFSFFVDENGKQIGQAYTGAYDWEPIVEELLK